MKSIELHTPNNIPVNVDVAHLGSRIIAFIIDVLILYVFALLMQVISYSNDIMFMLIILPISIFYHFACELLLGGQSIGKKLLKIKVISIDGTTPTFEQLLLRWTFRPLDILFTLGSGAVLCIITTEQNQRIGDLLANTIVISTNKSEGINLQYFETLNKQKVDHEKYPLIKSFTDAEMLLLKQTISRYESHRTLENRSLLFALVKYTSKKLEINPPTDKHLEFLKDVLNTYILNTR